MNNVKIISVEAKKSYYLVTTSINDYKFDEDTIVKYEVFNDKEFDKKEFEKIVKYNEEQIAFNKVIRYLGYGPRSKLEIIKYLKEKGIDNYKPTIKKLIEYGYINDEKLANDLVNYYMELKKGPLYILKKMDEKGIDDSIKNKTISLYDKDTELDLCYLVSQKELDTLTKYPIKKQKMSLYSKLLSKGFNSDVIRFTIDKLEFIDDSIDSLKKDYEKLVNKVNKKEMSDSEKKSYIIERLLAKGYEYKAIKTIL